MSVVKPIYNKATKKPQIYSLWVFVPYFARLHDDVLERGELVRVRQVPQRRPTLPQLSHDVIEFRVRVGEHQRRVVAHLAQVLQRL